MEVCLSVWGGCRTYGMSGGGTKVGEREGFGWWERSEDGKIEGYRDKKGGSHVNRVGRSACRSGRLPFFLNPFLHLCRSEGLGSGGVGVSEGSSWSQTTGRGSRVSAVQRRERPGSADPNSGSWSGTGGPRGSASLVPATGASAGLAASSWSGTGAPSTSNWGDWDSGAATGRTVPVHTCSR